ncbi:hypothetical protein FACS189459_1000 [Bacilli bacterium]|nr:hypothetical protein FACS189459_1000 [Bacilli bacterium]
MRLVIAPIDTVKSISAVLTGEFKVGVPVTNGAYITVTGANTVISDLAGLNNISNINGLSFNKGTANYNSVTYTISGIPTRTYNQNISISNGTLTCDVRLVIAPIDTVKSISAVLTGEFKVGVPVTNGAYITVTGANTVISDLDGLKNISNINGLSFDKGTANDNSITYTISGTPDNFKLVNVVKVAD